MKVFSFSLAKQLWRFSLLLTLFLFSTLFLVSVAAHNLCSENQRLVCVLNYLQPEHLVVFLVPSVIILYLMSYLKTSALFTGLFVCNLALNGDYRLVRSHLITPESASSLKVEAWNLQKFYFGQDAVIEQLKKSNADIFLLSEVSFSGSEQKRDFEDKLAPYQLFLSQQQDVAILTKLEAIAVKEVNLPSRQADLSRGNELSRQHKNPYRSFIHASLRYQGQIIDALSIRFIAGRAKTKGLLDRLSWGLYLWQEQDREVKFFKNYVAKLENPWIFGGDLNLTPNSMPLKSLQQLGEDAYLARSNFGDYTFKTKILPSSKEKDLPSMRLDYIFVSDAFRVTDSMIRRENTFSDHFPVWTSLSINPQSPLKLVNNDQSKNGTSH